MRDHSALVAVRPEPRTFTPRQVDDSLRVQLEMAIGYARDLLHPVPDPLTSPMISARRKELAQEVLDYAWALMAERNAQVGDPCPLPALIMFDPEVLGLRTGGSVG